MRLKAKIFLLAIVPFLLAIAGIGFGVRQQATSLARTQHATIQAAYLSSKEVELKHYVELATSAIMPLYDASGRNARDDAMLRTQALAMLQKMDFGPDGYFFVYDLHGNSLMHPREPERVGHNYWSMRDPQGALTIQKLIGAASSGGGYVRYAWQRPSTAASRRSSATSSRSSAGAGWSAPASISTTSTPRCSASTHAHPRTSSAR